MATCVMLRLFQLLCTTRSKLNCGITFFKNSEQLLRFFRKIAYSIGQFCNFCRISEFKPRDFKGCCGKNEKFFKKLHQDITLNLKIASLNRTKFSMLSRNLKIVLKLSITNSCFPWMPKFSECKSLVPLYLQIFVRS